MHSRPPKAGAADAKRLREKWAKAHFSCQGIGGIFAPNEPYGDEHFEKRQSPCTACQNEICLKVGLLWVPIFLVLDHSTLLKKKNLLRILMLMKTKDFLDV
jgi:hypothetical protein